jgi:hypothetical protein
LFLTSRFGNSVGRIFPFRLWLETRFGKPISKHGRCM